MATTLRWTFLLLSWYPEIQKKLNELIDSVLGREILPTMSDREIYITNSGSKVNLFLVSLR